MSEELPDASDVMEELGGQDDAEERGEMAQEDPVDDLDDVKDRLDSVEERVSFLEEEEYQNQRQIVDIFDLVFPARLTAFTSGTGGAWIERIASGTVLTDYTGGRFTSAATNISALFGLGETDFVTVEQVTVDGVRAPAVPSGVVDCYLTDLGSGSYDGYLDAAKTLKIFAAQTGQPATGGATKGFARLVGKTWRFVGPAGGYVGLLVAYLTKIGGANGDDGTATGTASYCTYTYNAYFDAAKSSLAGGTLTVQAHRMLQVAAVAPATLGIIQINSNNTYSLMTVLDEYWTVGTCPGQTTGMP